MPAVAFGFVALSLPSQLVSQFLGVISGPLGRSPVAVDLVEIAQVGDDPFRVAGLAAAAQRLLGRGHGFLRLADVEIAVAQQSIGDRQTSQDR